MFEEIAEKVSDRVIDAEAVQFTASRVNCDIVRENLQMANRNLYREDVLQMLFADSDSEGEYLPFGNDDRPSNDRASPGTSLQRNGAAHARRESSRSTNK